MRIAFPLLSAPLVACLMSSCLSNSKLDPDIVGKTNKAYQQRDEKRVRRGKPPTELLQLWGDRPEYVKMITEGGPLERGPRLISAAVPRYPLSGMIAGADAKVVVSIVIDEKGKVEEARISASSDQRFNSSALDAARKFTYLPALKAEGQPIKFLVQLPFYFKRSAAS